MPLPSMKKAKRCTAKAKSTGRQCENPVKGCTGRVCRLHGWVSPERKASGKRHGRHVYGGATKEAKAASAEELRELRQLEKNMKQKKLI